MRIRLPYRRGATMLGAAMETAEQIEHDVLAREAVESQEAIFASARRLSRQLTAAEAPAETLDSFRALVRGVMAQAGLLGSLAAELERLAA